MIAGQGTVDAEILREAADDPDAIFAPVGGGGLIASITVYVKSMRPLVRITGIDPADSAGMRDSSERENRCRSNMSE